MILRRNRQPDRRDQGTIVRVGNLVRLQKHTFNDEASFVRWYTDAEIAYMLRHDLRPLTTYQAQGYFNSIVLPNSALGTAWAIHENSTGELIGTTAVTELDESQRACLFRIVIGEKLAWGRGYGTDATRLVVAEVFESLNLHAVNLEVFAHNERAVRSYLKVGFEETGRTEEWAQHTRLDVIAMRLERSAWDGTYASTPNSR
jgi:RimJ/RimL family protein N-acetyltransferase